MYIVRSEHSISTDSSAYMCVGVPNASQSQILNIEIINCLWALAEGVWKIPEEFEGDGGSGVRTVMEEVVEVCKWTGFL
jgi:hypothetical protein